MLAGFRYYVFSKWEFVFAAVILGLIVLFSIESNRIRSKFERVSQILREKLSIGFFGTAERPKKKKLRNKINVYLVVAWILSFAATGALLWFYFSIAKKITPIDNSDHFQNLDLFLVFIISGNLIIGLYLESSKKSWWPVFSLVVWCFIFLLFSSFPKVVMHRFHFGSFTAERLIVDNKGCKILKSMELKPMPIKDKNDNDLKECYLEKIKILSRLGRVFVLEKEIDCKKFNFNIPKDHVLSWRISKGKEKEKAKNDKDSCLAQAKTDTEKKTETRPKNQKVGAS